jgi:hypothetical protein
VTLAEQMAADAAAAPSSAPKLSLAKRMEADAAETPTRAASSAASTQKSAKIPEFSIDSQRNEGAGPALMQVGAHAVTSAGSSIYGLVRGLGAMAGGGSLEDASNEIHDAQEKYTYQPPEGSGGALLLRAVGVPLSALARATGSLGDKTLDATGSPALATLADVGTNTVATLGAGKALKSVTGRGAAPVAPTAAPVAPVAPVRVEPTLPAPAPTPLSLVPRSPVPAPAGVPVEATPQVTPQAAPLQAGLQQAADTSAPQGFLQPSLTIEPPAAPTATPAAAAAPAAPTIPPPALEHASDGLRLAVARAQESGTPIDPTVLQRHIEADTLPVPMRLTAGQATLDPAAISQEMNSRGGKAPLVPPEFYNTQGKALAQNLDFIRQRAAPDVTADHPTDHGQVLIDQYKAMDAPVVADIDAKYQALRDANGGEFPVDAPQLLANTKAALKAELLSGDAPASQMSALEDLASEGKMTYEQFLNLRRNLGNVARTSTDGNTRTAASIMVQQLEDLPLQGGAADMKPLADAARSAARARFQAMDADPAYKAAVNDGVRPGEASPLADSFVQKYLINGPRANVLQMKQNLSGQPLAQQTIPAATVDYLRGKAKADVDTGQFNAASYNAVVDKLGPKFDALLDPASAATVQQVGNVAKYTTVQPKGSFVNNSNTLVGMGLDVAKNRIGDALNTATLGATGTIAGIAKGIGQVRAAKAATAPGAGITRLSDLLPPSE